MKPDGKLTLLEEIETISETSIREICIISLEEAQKNVHAPYIAIERMLPRITKKLDLLIKEGNS